MDPVVRLHTRMQPYSFNKDLTCKLTSMVNQFTHRVRQLIKQSSKTLRKINSPGTFVLSLLTSSTVVITVTSVTLYPTDKSNTPTKIGFADKILNFVLSQQQFSIQYFVGAFLRISSKHLEILAS